jgi:hypothetical protein
VRKVTRKAKQLDGHKSHAADPADSVRSDGAYLEARMQRLFLAQGTFAERSLVPAATTDRRMLATDVDVLASEYASGFHLTRRHVECKGGKFSLLDRILWLRGVRELLDADSSYLIGSELDTDAVSFARSLQIEIYSGSQLESWEHSAGIDPNAWPCRSDLQVYDRARRAWNERATKADGDEAWRWLRQGMLFVEVESWRRMSYRYLNKCLRLLGDLVPLYLESKHESGKLFACRYLYSALLVRLAQQLMAVCSDVQPLPATEREAYLIGRLTYGDQDPHQAAGLVQATVTWAKAGLRGHNIEWPSGLDVRRIMTAPHSLHEFPRLVEEFLMRSSEARYLVLATEREQFGNAADDKLTRLRAAANTGSGLAGLLKAFTIRAFGIPNGLADAVKNDLAKAYAPVQTEIGDPKSATRTEPSRLTTTATSEVASGQDGHDFVTERGTGKLFWPDGRLWGPVQYTITIEPPSDRRSGRIAGELRPADATRLAPFLELTSASGLAHLQLADGRWWACLVQSDGRAVNAGGIQPAKPDR